MGASWEEAYYRELSREKRKEMLEAAIEQEGMTPANELRSKLLEARYGKQLDGGHAVDYFVRGWMTLRYLHGTSSSFFARRKNRKEIEALREDWKFALAEAYGEIGQEVLYQELCNLAVVYMDLCKNDKNYGAILLGIGRMQDKSLHNKIAKDMFSIAYEAPEQLAGQIDLALFTRAVTEMFCEQFPNVSDDFLRLIEEKKAQA